MKEYILKDLITKPIKAPAVSIALPVYNGEKYICGALDSLLAQSFTDFELIISDNNSTDGTSEICKKYAALDVRIKYVRQVSNIGVVANFQYGLNNSQGEYFMWAAYDDRWDSTFLEKMINIHRYDPDCGVAFCDFEVLNYVTLERVYYSIVPSNARSCYLNYLIRIMQMNSNIFYGLFKRNVLNGFIIEPFDLFDVYLTLYIASCYKIRIANQCLFVSGVTSSHRVTYSITDKKYSYLPFVNKQFLRAKNIFGYWKAFVALLLLIIMIVKIKIAAHTSKSRP
jgi:glycosyltransferase involved in cell wall biosynthesis